MNIFEIELFADISVDTKAKIDKASVTRLVKKNEVIFLQEDEAQFFYIIRSGWVKLFRETLDGEEAIVDVITNGHIFGSHAIFEDGIYSYSAESVEPTSLTQIPLNVLMQCINADPKLAMNLMRLVSIQQKKHSREIEHLTIQSAPQRIGCFLLRLCKDRSMTDLGLNLPYDKSLMASRLGMKAETFSRALSKLREEVGISVNGSKVVIPSVGALAEYTCSSCSDTFPCDDAKV